MKFSILAVSLSLLCAQTHAAVASALDLEIRIKTRELLSAKNLDYRAMAKESLKGNGRFDRQRVEISGLLSDDDTRRIDPADFDDYIKPSVKTDKNRTFGDWLRSWGGRDYNRDMEEMRTAMRGEMSARALQTIAAYKGMEINEIVAHSWGSQLIYAAILNGEMRPPKKLIVVGVPDDDRAKWALLAARTGTAVFWGRADNDAAALDKGVKVAKEAARDVDFEAKWDAACADDKEKQRICLPHGRRPQPVVEMPIGNLPLRPLSPLGHDRADYYDRVREGGFFKGNAQQLQVADTKRVDREMRILEQEAMKEAHAEARKLVEEAHAQKEIAEREHDARLRADILVLAERSCATPGSVAQGELDALPSPYRSDFIDRAPYPLGSECLMKNYLYLGKPGPRASELERMSTPIAKPRPLTLEPPPLVPQVLFTGMFPDIRKLATTACRFPDRVSTRSLMPPVKIEFAPDDYAAALRFSSNFGACEREVFDRIVRAIQAGHIRGINDQWVRDIAANTQTPISATPPIGNSGNNGGNQSPPIEKCWTNDLGHRICEY